MKRIFLFLSLLVSICSQAQTVYPAQGTPKGTNTFLGTLVVDTAFVLPLGDTVITPYYNPAVRKSGMIKYKLSTNYLGVYNGTKWVRLNGPDNGTTAARPSNPPAGTQYYNTDIPVYQYYNGSTWVNFSGGSSLTALSTPASNSFTAGNTSGNQTWSNVSNELAYYAEIATNSGFTTGLSTATLPANTTAQSWTGLTNGVTYYTRVRAIADNINYSNSAVSTTSSGIPTSGFDTNFTGKFVALYSMSIGQGSNASLNQGWFYRFNYVYKQSLGDQNNHAVSGKRLQYGDSALRAPSGCNAINNLNFSTEVDAISNDASWGAYFINYGPNEIMLNSPYITADSFEEYQIKLTDVLETKGASRSKMVIMSTPYMKTPVAFCSLPSVSAHDFRVLDFVTASENAAKRAGVIYIDLYNKMYTHPKRDSFFSVGDGVHPNDTGHYYIALMVVNDPYVTATGNPKLYRPYPIVATPSSTQVALHWKGVKHATSYDVIYSTSSSFTSPVTVNSVDTAVAINGLTNSTTYWFKIVAKASGYINSDNDSVSATPTGGGGGPTDADATAYIAAVTGSGGTLSSPQQAALHQFYTDLKSAGVYTKITAMWLPTYTTAAPCKWNMKDPIDADANHRMTFHGTNTFSTTGVAGNGSTGYLDPHLDFNSTTFYSDDIHMSSYQSTNAGSTNGITWNNALGAFTSYTIIPKFTNGNAFLYFWNGNSINFPVASAAGFTLGVSNSTTLEIYKNGASLGSTSSSGHATLANAMYINSSSENVDKIQFASIGTALTSVEVAAFNTALAALLATF